MTTTSQQIREAMQALDFYEVMRNSISVKALDDNGFYHKARAFNMTLIADTLEAYEAAIEAMRGMDLSDEGHKGKIGQRFEGIVINRVNSKWRAQRDTILTKLNEGLTPKK